MWEVMQDIYGRVKQVLVEISDSADMGSWILFKTHKFIPAHNNNVGIMCTRSSSKFTYVCRN